MQPNRSYLFAPGNHPRRVEKSFTTGCDAVILDLEDAVAIAEKPGTRAVVVEALKLPRICRGYIRVNSIDTEFCFDDIEAVVGPWLDGIMLPKVERAADLQAVDSAFMADYFHVNFVSTNNFALAMVGNSGSQLGDGIQLTYDGNAPISPMHDRIASIGTAEESFHLFSELAARRDRACRLHPRARSLRAQRALCALC